MNKQLSESEALFKIVRMFIVQYLANVHNYKNVQNEAVNMLATYVVRTLVIKNLAVEMKRLLTMQGRTQPNCLHQLIAIKNLGLVDLQKFSTFIIEKRYLRNNNSGIQHSFINRSKSYKFPLTFFQKTLSKVFENDYQIANRYEKEKQLPNIRFIRTPYLFHFDEENQCLPFRCGIDQAFNKPAQFTYKNTIQKIQKEKKNVQNLVAFTRRQNRKALGLYLESFKQEQKPKKKTKLNQDQGLLNNLNIENDNKNSKEFDFIGFL